MPGLQKPLLIVDDQPFQIPQLFGAEAKVAGKGHRFYPKLARLVIPVNMHMGRLVGFMTVKI
jgi:hypothetical protein